VTAAAIYARVSSARQAKDQTIGSQLSALREHAGTSRLEVPEEWVFADEGHSGATLVRPGLEALRDLAAQGCLDVVLVYSPDRLARKFAYQALLIEELGRSGVRVEFVKGPRGDSPEDQLLIQFQGMFAEYEKAQLMERYRRGKAWRAKTGSVNVLGGAPFGYRYIRKTPESGAFYEVIPHEAALVAEMFRRYADDGAAIADLRRWLTDQGVRTRTGKERWDRSVIWGMLRNPAYAGTAVFGKTQVVHEPAGLNRTARLAGRTVPRQVRTQDRPREEWTGIPVPALVDEETFDRVQQRLADNKRFASRNTKVPSLLQGIAACASCGYGYYRTTTTTTAGNKIYYYRCLGSDDYRYQGGRVCGNKPVRADYADKVVWDHLVALLADPALIRAEIGKRLERARTSDPVTRKRGQLEQALAKTAASIAAMITAFSEQLLTVAAGEVGGKGSGRYVTRSVRDVGHDLNRDVRQACDSEQAGKLRGHDERASDAAAQCGLIDQEPRHRRRRVLAGEDCLPGHPCGYSLVYLRGCRAGERSQQRERERLGLQQTGQQ
jgi:site-specific DNA recombinase